MRLLTRLFLPVLLIGFALTGKAQIDPNATGLFENGLKFSRTFIGGTARIQAMAGAQCALGADISTTLVNPAGLGLYRRSDLSFSPALTFVNTDATYTSPSNTSTTSSGKTPFQIASFGYVFNETDYSKDWRSYSLSLGFNQNNNFNTRSRYSGRNADNAMGDFFLENMQGQSFDNFLTDQFGGAFDIFGLAYDTWLVNPSTLDLSDTTFVDDGNYFFFDEDAPVIQEEIIKIKGATSSMDIGYGANYKDRLFLGGSLSFVFLRHDIERTYTETTEGGIQLNNFTYVSQENTDATGFNFKLGGIYKASDLVRFGLSFESPTWYNLNEEFYSKMTANYFRTDITYSDGTNDVTIFIPENPISSSTTPFLSEYKLQTPIKATFGTAFFFEKRGFISGDVEYVPYQGIRLRAFGSPLDGDNQTIKDNYKNVFNLRFGGELRFDLLRLRAGYAFYPDPIKNSLIHTNLERHIISGGIGIKTEVFYVDLALINQRFHTGILPYTLSNGREPTVDVKNNELRMVITGGITF